MKPPIAVEALRSIFEYFPLTGDLYWRVTAPGRSRKRPAGTTDDTGYRRVRIGGYQYRAHILIWAYVTGEWHVAGIDHRNLDRGDNRWDNLRKADCAQNCWNIPAHCDKAFPLKGAYWSAGKGRWISRICHRGIHYHLGQFGTGEEAHAAYAAAANDLCGEFARAA